ncbi:hypothetical protein [Phascolarctobacterium sp.]
MIENEVWLINKILMILNIGASGIFFVAKLNSQKPQKKSLKILIFLFLGMAGSIQLLEIFNISNFQYANIITLFCNLIWTRIMYKDIDFINFWQSFGKE